MPQPSNTERVGIKDVYQLVDRETSKLYEKIQSVEDKIDNRYVPRTELDNRFKPIEDDLNRFKNLVYGTIATLIGLIVAAVAGGKLL